MSSIAGNPNQSLGVADREPANALQAVTLERLTQYRRRRSNLSFWGGLGIVMLAAVLSLLTAVLLDALILQDGVRWIAAGLFYSTVLVGFYWFCFRPILTPLDLVEEAKRFETHDERLRERVLPAIELSMQPRHGDSPAFREQVQLQAAGLVASVDVRQWLPAGKAIRFVVLGAGAIALLLLGCQIPGLFLSQRFARVLFPAADLGRVSLNAITIEQPTPNTKTVPIDDLVAIVARVDGPEPTNVTLEIRDRESARTIDMQRMLDDEDASETSSRYEAVLALPDGERDYRITAAGAQTPWNRLTAMPRPKVVEFRQSIQPPAYTEQPEFVFADERGEIEAMVGSRVRLEIAVNLPVSKAEIEWVDGYATDTKLLLDDAQRMPLATDSNRQQATAEFTVERNAEYRVHLVATETGFSNAFSPTIRIRAIEDRVPVLTWIQPRSSSIVAGQEQLLDLAMQITDELPLKSIIQRVRLFNADTTRNGDNASDPTDSLPAWNETPLDLPPVNTLLNWTCDLLPLNLSAGDILQLQVVALDRNDQSQESSIVRILIASASIDIEPTDGERLRQEVAQKIESMTTNFEAAQTEMRELREALSKNSEKDGDKENVQSLEPSQLEQLQQTAETFAAELNVNTKPILEKIELALAEADDPVSELELRSTAALLEKLRTDTLREIGDDIRQLRENPNDENAKQVLTRARDAASLIEQSLRTASEAAADFRAMVTHDVVRRYATQLTQLADAQTQILQAAETGELSVEQLQRQQMVLNRQLREIQQHMRQAAGVRRETTERLGRAADEMNWMMDQAERIEGNADPANMQQSAVSVDLPDIERTAKTLAESLSRMRLLQNLDGGVFNIAKDGLRRMEERSGAADDPAQKLAQELRNNTAHGSQADDVERQLATRRTLNRTGPSGDRTFASDLGKARRALAKVDESTELSRVEKAERIAAISESLATLSANNSLNEAVNLLANLERTENWSLESVKGTSDQPRTWETYANRLDQTSRQMRESGVPEEIWRKLDQLRWNDSANRAGQQIMERRWSEKSVVSASSDLQRLSQDLAEVKSMMAEHVELSRSKLAEVSPKISDLAHAAAEATHDVEQQTGQLAENVAKDEVPDPQTRLAGLESELAQLNDPIGELREALVDQADAQNLLETRDIQLARQADTAIDIVDRAEEQTATSLDNVSVTPSADAASDDSSKLKTSELNQAAEKQADAAEAFEQLAKHFEQTEAMPDDAVTAAEAASQLAELNAMANELGEDGEYDSASPSEYDQAERLSKLNDASPEEVLRQLEQQLKKNQPMQQEMSQIAASAARRALGELEQAAKSEESLNAAIESSDPVMQAQKELLSHDLQSVRQLAQNLTRSLIQEAQATAATGKQPIQERQLQQVQEQLQQAEEAAGQLNGNSTFDEIRTAAAQLSETLDAAQPVLTQKSKELDQAKDEAIHQNDNDRNNRSREMRDRQRRIQQQEIRTAQQAQNAQRQMLNRTENTLKQAEQRVRSDKQRLDQLQKQAAKSPDQQNLKDQIAEQEKRIAVSQANAAAKETLRDALKQRAQSANAFLESINQEPQSALESKNPSAELASALAARAAERSRQLSDALENWTTTPPAQTQASAQQLSDALKRQQNVEKDVAAASDDLARASRHEARLGQLRTSAELAQLSQAAESVDDEQIQAAEDRLAAAVAEASENGTQTSQASSETSKTVAESIAAAEDAIENTAEAVRNMLADNSNPPGAAGESPSESSSSPSQANNASQSGQASSTASSTVAQSGAGRSAPLSPQQMAQLLDELDRQLNSGQELGQQDNNQNQSGQDGSRGSPTPATLAEAARRLAESMSRNRQPPKASSDLGLATQSMMANAAPQAPVAVRVSNVDRIDGDWGELRQQSAEEMVESRRDTLSPTVRRQVDAYFKTLAERSQLSDAGAKNQ